MIIKNKYVILLVAATLAVSWVMSAFSTGAGAIVIRHDKADEEALRLGDRFDAACRVIPDGGCTLIGPRWVATAAHVAASIQKDGEIAFGEKRYKVRHVIIHPEGVSRQPRTPPRVDLALVELAAAVEGITPAAIYRGTGELGMKLFLVGYGDYGNPKAGMTRFDGKRRAATNIVDDAGELRIFMKFDAPPGGTELEGVSGPGDSGGGAFYESDGKLYLVGISSGSMDGRPGQYGVVDVYTRMSSYKDWIDGKMNGE